MVLDIPQEGLTLKDAADQLGITLVALRKRAQRGTIPAFKDAKNRWRVLLDKVEEPLDKAGLDKAVDRSTSPYEDVLSYNELAEARIEDLRQDKRRLEGQVDGLLAEMTAIREEHAEMMRRKDVLLQGAQNQVTDMTAQVSAPPPPDSTQERRETRQVMAGIVEVLGRLYRRQQG